LLQLANKTITEPTPIIASEVIHTIVPFSVYTVKVVDFENVDTHGTSKRVYLSAVVNDKPVLCMCDSGSNANFMPYNLVEPKNVISMSMKSYANNGTVIEIFGHCMVLPLRAVRDPPDCPVGGLTLREF